MVSNPLSAEKRALYQSANKVVKAAVKAQTQNALECKIKQLELDHKHNNSHNLFRTVRELEGKPRKPMSVIKDKQGNTHADKKRGTEMLEKHFSAHLNTAFHHQSPPPAIDEIPGPPEEADDLPSISLEEIEQAVKNMKNRKAPGIDNITAEVLKAGGKPMAEMLHKIFNAIWVQERTPKNWARMLITPIHKKGDKHNPGNYRAISLLSIPGKVL